MKNAILFVLTLAVWTSVGGCKKYDPGDDVCPACPRITNIVPSHAKGGDIITINGTNFNPNFSENKVTINGRVVSTDSLLSGTSEYIKLFVPKNCGSGPVTIDADPELTFAGASPIFTYDYKFTVSHYAGSVLGETGFSNGQDTNARFFINYMAMDYENNIFVIDSSGQTIRKVAPPLGNLGSTVTSVGNYPGGGSVGGICISGDFIYVVERSGQNRIYKANRNSFPLSFTMLNPNNPITGVELYNLTAAGGFLFATAPFQNKIMKFDLQSTSWVNYTGSGLANTVDGPVAFAGLSKPWGICYNQAENALYFSQTTPLGSVRKIDLQSEFVSTIAGNPVSIAYLEGDLFQASFSTPLDLASNLQGTVYINDKGNRRVARIYENRIVTVAGTGAFGYQDGNGPTQVSFENEFKGIVISSNGDAFVASNSCIRKITVE
ncbi:MAG: IPT/TIG domain-containing protein [Bacteroidota bacterium]